MAKTTIEETLTRGVEEILPSEDALKKVLEGGKKLRIYHGIDPTGPDLHLGHATNLFTLRRFQLLGHKVILLIGDFTAMIGDPTGKVSRRQQLSHKEALENAKGYIKQVSKILKFEGLNAAEVKYNSQWLSKLSMEDWFRLASLVTYQQLIERDMFQARIRKGKDIFLHEFFYPLMQAYDSVALDVDLEIGGTDQTFNMLLGRRLAKKMKNKEKFVLTTKLLVNPKTGRKLMNKSEGTLIALSDPPSQIYGKSMALPDEVVFDCLKLSTDLKDEEIAKAQKMSIFEAKKFLAKTLVRILHSLKDAESAGKEFENIFPKKGVPSQMEELNVGEKSLPLLDLLLLTPFVSSSTVAKAKIREGAVDIDGKKLVDPHQVIEIVNGQVMKFGKRGFVKIRHED